MRRVGTIAAAWTAMAPRADKMVTNGAYNITEWQHQDHITLTKNDNYWNAAEEASIKTIKFVMIDDTNTALNGFMTGEYDMIGLSGQQKKDLEAEGRRETGPVCRRRRVVL